MSVRRYGLAAAAVALLAVGLTISRRPVVKLPDGAVNSTACAGCHREIWEKFRSSGMGRSLRRATPAAMPPGFAEKVRFYHEASDRHYTLTERDGKYFQRRHQVGPKGEETNVFEREIHYVVGSGNHARTFFFQSTDGRLYELPLAWYAEGGGTWAMNPGYDYPNHADFRREIQHECLFCHTAYPEIAAGADRTGSEPIFPSKIPEGIDCERCHGPGRAHVEATASKDPGRIRSAIVNPARLQPERQLEVCLQCHLESTSSRLPHSILRWKRGVFSFRPGEALGDYAIHFDHAPGTGRDDKFEIASHAYRFRKSACYQKSGGKLTCTTCHDPHGKAERAPAIAACQKCHSSLAANPRHPADPDCVKCHMPSRRTEDVVHVAMTDHFIQRRPPAGDLLALRKERPDTTEAAYEGPVMLYYPRELLAGAESDLYLAVAQVKQFSNLKGGVPRLEKLLAGYPDADATAHLELAQAFDQLGDTAKAARYFESALAKNPNLQPARIGLAQSLSKAGDNNRAVQVLEEALQKLPSDAIAWNALGLVRLRRDDLAGATDAFRKATSIRPEYAEACNNLAGALAQSGDRAGAASMFREAVRLDPGFASAHRNLAKLADRIEEAEYHFRKAIYHGSKYAPAHFDYGLALAGAERYAEAAQQFSAAIAADPAMAEAHSNLGDMMALLGKPAEAVGHYKRALQLRPDLESARAGLAGVGR